MTRLLLLLAVLPCLALYGAGLSFAQDDVSEEQTEQDIEGNGQNAEEDAAEPTPEEIRRESAKIQTMDPDLRKLNTDLADLTKALDANNRRHFYTLYNNNNLISTVKYVRDQIGEAISACSENNPDMENALRARYKDWTDAINEKLDEAEAQVENMILVQDYATDKDVNNILKQADDLRAKTQKNVERIPVTSKEACEYLLNKMDETQANMLSYLNSVLVAMPQAMDE